MRRQVVDSAPWYSTPPLGPAVDFVRSGGKPLGRVNEAILGHPWGFLVLAVSAYGILGGLYTEGWGVRSALFVIVVGVSVRCFWLHEAWKIWKDGTRYPPA